MKIFTKLKLSAFFILLLVSQTIKAQDSEYDSLLNYYLKSDSILLDQLEYELASDSLDIMDLIDSLLYSDFRFSQLSVRLGYTSSITYAGRNFGIDQHGFATGVAYYHKSGLFADISGYWNSDIAPNYNPTITTAGYFGKFTRKWTYTLTYDHYFYQTSGNEDTFEYYPITNSVNASTYLELGKFTLAGEYSFLFGEEQAHRVRGNLMYTFSKNKWGFIDRFVFMPTATILLGDADIYQVAPVYTAIFRKLCQEAEPIMDRQYGDHYIDSLKHNRRYRYRQLVKETYYQFQDELTDYVLTIDNVFGVMNYSLSTPFYFYVDNFMFSLSYHYNIPVALPGEDLDLKPNSYIGATLMYSIPFIKKRTK